MERATPYPLPLTNTTRKTNWRTNSILHSGLNCFLSLLLSLCFFFLFWVFLFVVILFHFSLVRYRHSLWNEWFFQVESVYWDKEKVKKKKNNKWNAISRFWSVRRRIEPLCIIFSTHFLSSLNRKIITTTSKTKTKNKCSSLFAYPKINQCHPPNKLHWTHTSLVTRKLNKDI